ncbi:MAG TPA: ATP-dependent helicase, partial [Anaeromyxobacter sp.]
LFERFDGEVRSKLRLAEQKAKEAVARREAEEDALVEAVFEDAPEPEPEAPAKGKQRRAKLVRAAAEKVRARPQDAVSFLEVPSRHLPASLGKLAGREGWWFAYKFGFDALVSDEKVVHLVLWFDGESFHALSLEDADAFAALPAEECKAGPRGATVSIGAAQEEALQALHARLVADVLARSQTAFDESRERWDRSVEDALAAPRKAIEEARAAWAKARGALHDDGLPLRDRRAFLERAEREYRRKLDELRATEAQRYAEKDRAITDLKKRAEPKERRTLVATAYWRCP